MTQSLCQAFFRVYSATFAAFLLLFFRRIAQQIRKAFKGTVGTLRFAAVFFGPNGLLLVPRSQTCAAGAVVIALKDGYCSPFAVSHWLAYRTFGEICEFYGAEPTDAGIESISYTIAVPENGAYRVSGEKTITDAETIDGICTILSQLTPEDPPVNEKAPTPEWLIDAMQEYRENPERFTAEDIVVTVRFRNGTVMRDILYKPYIGNGYLDNMKELTPRQNAELRALFG